MDCSEIGDLLDAYALGAADADEAAALEEHVAECVRCWSSLNEAQRAAATIALSTAFQHAPPSLRDRILAETERAERPSGPRLGALLRKLLPAGVGVLAAGAAASLAFAFVLQAEVNDLQQDNDQLAAEVESTDARLTEQQQLISAEIESAGERLTEQQQLMAVLAAPDVQQVTLGTSNPSSPAVAVYQWSDSAGAGALLCNNLPHLQEGQLYQVWFLAEGDSYHAGSFKTWDGIGQLSVELVDIPERTVAIGVSIQDAADAEEPGEMFLFAEFQP